MNKYTLIPSDIQYQASPSVDQEISISLDQTSQQLTEYDRSVTINLAQIYDDERQSSVIFRPTFKVSYIYDNVITGSTNYLPFQYNLYYVTPEESSASGIWRGYPQYYEFDFFRPKVEDQHFEYKSKSAYTYNWMYYLTYPVSNDTSKKLFCSLPQIGNVIWIAGNGIPFSLKNTKINGSQVISFQCVSPHGLTIGEFVELSFSYSGKNLFQVNSLGDGKFGSEENIFNILNIGYTGTTFSDNKTGTFKRVINPDNLVETKSKYYVRRHKVLTNLDDLIVTRSGFEKNVFNEEKKFEFSSITPNKVSRISQKSSSNAFNFTVKDDLNISTLLDNQQRPISEIYLTIINKGYSGYFNYPFNNVGIKQGWEFNLTNQTNSWWDGNNIDSNSNINVLSYTKNDGINRTFYYNKNLTKGDIIDGDFCEWNDFEQVERVISKYYQKIKFNQNVFQTSSNLNTNSPGYYYAPHNPMTIRVFSNYVETASLNNADGVPNYAFYSEADNEFRWRDIYSYGYVDEQDSGVDYPYLNKTHYPFSNVIFRLIPEGINYNDNLLGDSFSIKPLVDECE